ncbi:hypothetical protein F5X96DRAFT_665324 [Biscogniauxia mediterranea]|nr:hypothetical protein F5X96DRAFT_665324 [Biscogniauxia mediterranea]
MTTSTNTTIAFAIPLCALSIMIYIVHRALSRAIQKKLENAAGVNNASRKECAASFPAIYSGFDSEGVVRGWKTTSLTLGFETMMAITFLPRSCLSGFLEEGPELCTIHSETNDFAGAWEQLLMT